MRVQLVKVNKNNRIESSLSEFLNSAHLFFWNATSKANTNGKITPIDYQGKYITDTEKRESLLESKLQTSSEKMSSLQGTVSVLNMCIVQENQGRLKADKELQVLSNDLKKQMKEKMSQFKTVSKKDKLIKIKYQKHK